MGWWGSLLSDPTRTTPGRCGRHRFAQRALPVRPIGCFVGSAGPPDQDAHFLAAAPSAWEVSLTQRLPGRGRALAAPPVFRSLRVPFRPLVSAAPHQSVHSLGQGSAVESYPGGAAADCHLCRWPTSQATRSGRPAAPLRMAQPPAISPTLPEASSPDVALATRMAQPCASTSTQSPCCRFGGVRCNPKKVAAVASVEIDALIGPPAGGTGMGTPNPEAIPVADAGCDCGGSGGGAAAAPSPTLPQAPASDVVDNVDPLDASLSAGLRPKGVSVGFALGFLCAPHGRPEPPEAERTTMAAARGPALPKLASAGKRLASATHDPFIADGEGGPRRTDTAVAKRVALSPKPGIVVVAKASSSTGTVAAAASPPAPRPKRSRRVVGREPMPREQRVYFTCAACGYDRNHIRKRTCDRCRAPKIAMPSGSAVEAARSARRGADAEPRWGVAGAAGAEAHDGGGAGRASRGSLPGLAPAPVGVSEAGGAAGGGKGSASWSSPLHPLRGRPPTSSGASHPDHHSHLQLKHE